MWAICGLFLVVTLLDWWITWGEQRVIGRVSEKMLLALRVKVFAHLQRLGVDYYEHEMAGRIMTRMTTDLDALSQLLQNGLVNALVNFVTFVGIGIALAIMNPRLALVHGHHFAAARAGDDVVPPSTRHAPYETARERIAVVNANLQEGLSGVRVLAGIRTRGDERGRVRRAVARAISMPASPRSASSRSSSRSSTSCPTWHP